MTLVWKNHCIFVTLLRGVLDFSHQRFERHLTEREINFIVFI